MTEAGKVAEWLIREEGVEKELPDSERIAVEDDFWRATITRFRPADGLRVYLTRAEIWREVTLDGFLVDPEPRLMAQVAVSGTARIAFPDGIEAEISPRRSILFRPAGRRGSFTIGPQPALRHVGYVVRADRVRQMFGDDLPDVIEALIGEFGPTHLVETPTSVRTRRLAASLFSDRLHGSLRLIHMEGVALQLLATQAATVSASRPRRRSLSEDARKQIETARKRLIANVANPPSLGQLAAEAGMSDRALSAGFRTLFGSSVYEVLRDERLAQARLALESTDAPIKQIAHRVGYSHVSNFTNAFAARYGAPPARLRGRLLAAAEAERP